MASRSGKVRPGCKQSPKVECLEEEHKMPREVLQSTYCLLGTLCKSEQDPPGELAASRVVVCFGGQPNFSPVP